MVERWAPPERLRVGKGNVLPILTVGLLLMGPERRLRFANSRAMRLLGCSGPEQLEDRIPELHDRLSPALEALAAGQPEASLDLAWPEAPSARALRFQVSAIGPGGREGWLATIQDRQTLGMVPERLGMGSFLWALSRLNASQTHDLRGHLGSLALHVGLLGEAQKLASGQPETRAREERYLAAIDRDLRRLQGAVEALLEQTRLDGDDPQEQGPREFDLRDVLEDLGTLLATQCKRRRVEWSAVVPEEPAPVAGSRIATQHALTWLVVRAADTTPAGGTLVLRLSLEPAGVTLEIDADSPDEPIAELELDVVRSALAAQGGRLRPLGDGPGARRIQIDWPKSHRDHSRPPCPER